MSNVTPLRPDRLPAGTVAKLLNVHAVWAMPSTNPPGQVRIVVEFEDGRMSCSYPGHGSKRCGHVERTLTARAREEA